MSKCAILDSLEFAKNKTKEGRKEESKEGDEDEDGGGIFDLRSVLRSNGSKRAK
jgi:hypothetical protein